MKGKFIVDMDQLSNADYVLALAKMYKCGSDDYQEWGEVAVNSDYDEDEEKSLDWYIVGHNSTHQFYLAVDEANQMWRKSYSAYTDVDTELMSLEEYRRLMDSDKTEDWQQAMEAEKWVEEKNINQVERGNLGYIGHW